MEPYKASYSAEKTQGQSDALSSGTAQVRLDLGWRAAYLLKNNRVENRGMRNVPNPSSKHITHGQKYMDIMSSFDGVNDRVANAQGEEDRNNSILQPFSIRYNSGTQLEQVVKEGPNGRFHQRTNFPFASRYDQGRYHYRQTNQDRYGPNYHERDTASNSNKNERSTSYNSGLIDRVQALMDAGNRYWSNEYNPNKPAPALRLAADGSQRTVKNNPRYHTNEKTHDVPKRLAA